MGKPNMELYDWNEGVQYAWFYILKSTSMTNRFSWFGGSIQALESITECGDRVYLSEKEE
jgi:hypothetical protein